MIMKMGVIVFILLLLTVTFILANISDIQTGFSQTESYLTYENATSGYSIQYPSDWNAVSLNNSGYYGGIVFEPQSKSVSFRVLVELTNQTFEDWSSDYLSFLDSLISMSDIAASIGNDPGIRDRLESHETTLGGLPAWQAVVGNSTFLTNYMWTVKDGHAYLIITKSDLIDSKVYLSTFDKMWDSFKIIR
jgi:hypothetical protein